jgi:hypothetical protein
LPAAGGAPDDTLLGLRRIGHAEADPANAESDHSLVETRPNAEEKMLHEFEQDAAAASIRSADAVVGTGELTGSVDRRGVRPS